MKNENSFKKNYASDQETADRFMEMALPIILRTRMNRKTLEAKWLEDTRLWSCVLDNAGYVGRANIFVPELHNQIENTTEKLVANTFANPEIIKAVPRPGTSLDKAQNIQDAVTYELQSKNNLMSLWDEFERSKTLYGTAIFKGGFEKKVHEIFYKDPKTLRVKKSEVATRLGAYWSVKSIFRWYIYPEFARLDDYEMVFEDALIPFSELSREKKKYTNIDNIHPISKDIEHLWVDVDLLEMADLSEALADNKERVVITEVYCMFDLVGGERVPVQAFIANNNTLIRLVRNPFWWQDHPYLGDVYLQRPNGIFYGFSMPDKLRSQQYQITDLTNHTMDSLTYSLNPIAVVDPALAGDVNSMKIAPGAKWLGSPEGIQMLAFPDVSGSGLRAIAELRGQIAQFSDNSPGLAPQLEGKARSATQASIVQKNVSVRQRVQAGREEEKVLSPMCKKTHILLQQFMDDKMLVKVFGVQAGEYLIKEVDPADIVGDVEFVWKGTSYVERSAVRSQQLLGFFSQALQIAALMPGEVDIATLFKRIARDAFEISDLDEIFKSLRDKKTVDPEIENMALMNGDEVKVHNGDDDEMHLKAHALILDDPKASEDAKLKALNHMETHREQLQAKKAVIELRGRINAMQQEQGAAPQMGGPQAPPSPLEGNRGQVATSEADVMTGAKGVQPL